MEATQSAAVTGPRRESSSRPESVRIGLVVGSAPLCHSSPVASSPISPASRPRSLTGIQTATSTSDCPGPTALRPCKQWRENDAYDCLCAHSRSAAPEVQLNEPVSAAFRSAQSQACASGLGTRASRAAALDSDVDATVGTGLRHRRRTASKVWWNCRNA